MHESSGEAYRKAATIWGWFTARDIALWGSLASTIVLGLIVHIERVRPRLRERKLKRTVEAHFTVRTYENDDIEPHHFMLMTVQHPSSPRRRDLG